MSARAWQGSLVLAHLRVPDADTYNGRILVQDNLSVIGHREKWHAA